MLFWSIIVGALAYADDLVLLAPTPSTMRNLLAICDKCAQKFSTVLNSLAARSLLDRAAALLLAVPLFCL